MSFRIRDTSIAFQQDEPQSTTKKTKKNKKGKTEKKSEFDTETPSTPPKKNSSMTGGFQMKHDPTNQCDYF